MMNAREWIRRLFEKFLSIFNRKKYKPKEVLDAINTYNDSNLALLLNSFEFISSIKKTNELKGVINNEGK